MDHIESRQRGGYIVCGGCGGGGGGGGGSGGGDGGGSLMIHRM